MSKWQEEKAERNRQSLIRLTGALPRIFPTTVLSRALGHRFLPPTPNWSADRLEMATGPKPQRRATNDIPNAAGAVPEQPYSLGPGFCCVCGQPLYRLGWHKDLCDAGPNKKAVWHCACVVAWQFWNTPNSEAALLRRLQGRRCGQTGGRRDAEVDHRTHCFGSGVTIAMKDGRNCSATGDCRTCR